MYIAFVIFQIYVIKLTNAIYIKHVIYIHMYIYI